MRWAILPFAFVVGCGHADDGDTIASTGGDTTAASNGSSTAASDATGSSDGSGVDTTGGEGGLSHGFVQLQLVRAPGEASDPFPGTATVIAVLQYTDCLVDFYANHPELRQDGAEGAAIFGGSELGGEGWLDRLCSPAISGHIECQVMAILQDVDIVQQLTIVYSVTGAVEDGVLLFGPLPTQSTAMCATGLPTVRVGATNAVTGNAANGTQLWGTDSFDPAEASTNQSDPIEIRVAAVGG